MPLDGTKTNEELLLHYGFTLPTGAAADTVQLRVSLSERHNQLLSHAGFATAVCLEASAADSHPPPVSLLAPMRVAMLTTDEMDKFMKLTPMKVRSQLEQAVGMDSELRALSALCATLAQRSSAVADNILAATEARRSAVASGRGNFAQRVSQAWSDAVRYVDGQLAVLDSHHCRGIFSYRSLISLWLQTQANVPSSGLCCVTEVEEGQCATSFPVSACITFETSRPPFCVNLCCAGAIVLISIAMHFLSAMDARGASPLGGTDFQSAIRTPSVADAIDDETAVLLFVLAIAGQPVGGQNQDLIETAQQVWCIAAWFVCPGQGLMCAGVVDDCWCHK